MATLLTCVPFLVLVLGIGNSTGMLCCVRPEEIDTCPESCQENCYTLMYYVNHTEEYFNTSNTTFLFLTGEHDLENGTFIANVSDLTLMYDVNNASLIHDMDNVSDASQATVMCNGSGGFSFFNITNLTITGLKLVGCSKRSQYFYVYVAVEMSLIFNLKMLSVSIHNTTGFGLMTDSLFGTATITQVDIDSSHSTSHAYGGNFAVYCNDWQFLNNGTNHSLTVSESQFVNGINKYKGYKSSASGIYIHIICKVSMNITFYRVTVRGNVGGEGGNIGILYVSTSNRWTVVISISNSTISSGFAHIGSGFFMTTVADGSDEGSKAISMPVLNIISTTFSHNISPTVGSGVYLRLHENYVSTVGMFTFHNCTFSGNMMSTSSNDVEAHGGVAVHMLTYLRPEYQEHLTPLFRVMFTNCTFSQNAIQDLPAAGGSNTLSSRVGVFFVQNIKSLYFSNCSFVNNSCAAVVAINSNLLLNDWNNIQNNTGTRGGGMVFCAGSLMHLYTGTILNITENNAMQYGGGIYVEDDCTQVIPYCFFQVDDVTANSSVLNKTKINLINNRAEFAGSALYGGLVDSCTLIDKVNQKYPQDASSKVFNATFHIEGDDSSKISSDPIEVCFCQNHCSCDYFNQTQNIVPGATFQVSVILTGQRSGFVPGVVDATCTDGCKLIEEQKTQLADNPNCSVLTYTISAKEDTNQTLSLVAEDSYYEYSSRKIQPSTTITLHVGTCPLGFKAQNNACECILPQVKCNISSKTITRQPPSWIGYKNIPPPNTSDIIFHRFCPLGYCYDKNITITTTSTSFDQDAQCVQNRCGLLCGTCQQNYSLGFGSYDCMHCASKLNSLRTAGLVMTCAVAGILLVLLLTLLNLTVSEGTLNGLIFYANIVQVNSDIFFSSESHARFLATFIAWLNLDFGIKVCFFDGMDEYARTWLQFVFPLYIWLISVAIVYFSWNYNIVARLAGKNAVKVLATLFLLSFGKLLRTIIAAIAFTVIRSPQRRTHEIVWLPDANIPYLHGRHIVLFAFAIMAAVVTLIYTLSLLFIQCLRKFSDTPVFSWVERMKPLFDAYTGPYKEKYHFWTGLLLLARIFLFVCFAVNATNGPALNLTLIIMVCSILMIVIHVQVYTHVALGLLESSMYLNLILFSTTMMFLLDTKYARFKPAAAYTFSGSVLLTFFGIVAYHFYKQVFGTQSIGKLKVWCQERRWTQQVTRIQPVAIPRDDSEGSDESDGANEMESLVEENPSMDATQLREPLIGSIQ